MTQVFTDDGRVQPVTVIEAGPCYVTQIKTVEKDGYSSVQVAFGEIKAKNVNKCQTGAFKKAGVGTMVMTLWSVSDKVATEFMIKFYESLVENDWDKHKAFEQTKSYIRTQHPDPYHWAAFVMLD